MLRSQLTSNEPFIAHHTLRPPYIAPISDSLKMNITTAAKLRPEGQSFWTLCTFARSAQQLPGSGTGAGACVGWAAGLGGSAARLLANLGPC